MLPGRLMQGGSQVIGKVTNNSTMHERGELREAGGKAAVQGQARAPHI
jgi:hypothetical protein